MPLKVASKLSPLAGSAVALLLLEFVAAELLEAPLVDDVLLEVPGVVVPVELPEGVPLALPVGAPEVVESPPDEPAEEALLPEPLVDAPLALPLADDCLDVVSLLLVVPPLEEALLESPLFDDLLVPALPVFRAPSAPISVWLPD